jgi:uncharacterized protein (DUF983 family)
MPFRPALVNALRLRCPNCQKGAVFGRWLNEVLQKCPLCGLSYYRESGYYVVAMMLTYWLTAFTLLPIYLIGLLFPDVKFLSENGRFAAWAVLAIILTLGFVRPAYSLWLSADFWISPWDTKTSSK